MVLATVIRLFILYTHDNFYICYEILWLNNISQDCEKANLYTAEWEVKPSIITVNVYGIR